MRRERRARLAVALLVSLVLVAVVREARGAPASADAGARDHRLTLSLGARFMPVGWFDLADEAGRSFRAYPALGGEAFGDVAVTPILDLGLAVEMTGNVIPNRSDYRVGTMWAGALRASASYATAGRLEPYGTLTIGYSTILLAGDSSSARGVLIGGWVGARFKLSSRHRVFGQLGYQRGFQERDGGAYAPSYLVTELGWSLAL